MYSLSFVAKRMKETLHRRHAIGRVKQFGLCGKASSTATLLPSTEPCFVFLSVILPPPPVHHIWEGTERPRLGGKSTPREGVCMEWARRYGVLASACVDQAYFVCFRLANNREAEGSLPSG